MERKLEKAFFRTFREDGLAGRCIEYLTLMYIHTDPEKGEWWTSFPEEEFSEEEKKRLEELNAEIQRLFAEMKEQQVSPDVEGPLMEEIADNLDSLREQPSERERYVFSLLAPFWTYSNHMFPFVAFLPLIQGNISGIDGIPQLDEKIRIQEEALKNPELDCEEKLLEKIVITESLRKKKAHLESLKDAHGEHSLFPFLCAELQKVRFPDGSPEEVMKLLTEMADAYATSLEAVLLFRGLNLTWFEQESGISLSALRDERKLFDYLGGEILLRRYEEEAEPKTDWAKEDEKKQREETYMQEMKEREIAAQKERGKPGPKLSDEFPWSKNLTKAAIELHRKEMHLRIDPLKKGSNKEIVKVIVEYLKRKIIDIPSYPQVEKEFPNIGSQSGYSKQFNNQYTLRG